jgi:hypothetical protein
VAAFSAASSSFVGRGAISAADLVGGSFAGKGLRPLQANDCCLRRLDREIGLHAAAVSQATTGLGIPIGTATDGAATPPAPDSTMSRTEAVR